MLGCELAYRLFTACERFQHLAPRTIGQRRKDGVKGVIRILNHSVQYRRAGPALSSMFRSLYQSPQPDDYEAVVSLCVRNRVVKRVQRPTAFF